ncbi:hypothetical protein ScalyP_jg10497 [Parmales sp. scaly parma]|nr:hypothetical protein ScalyP_jg10497 [Parmales sp. scaly parma]
MDMGIGKSAELACESVPGSLLQVYVYITSPKKTTFQLVSILISTMTTAFSSATLSYDVDVSVKNRKKNPEFYGYVKDSNLERITTQTR